MAYYLIQALTGVVLFISVMIFGSYGFLAVLLSLIGFVFKGEEPVDEREYQLFYKSGTYTLNVVIVACVLLHIFGSKLFLGYSLNDISSPILLSLIYFVNGTTSAYLIAKN